MAIPQAWHRRQALLLAAQLPDDRADARLVVEAVRELLDTFLAEVPGKVAEIASNVLPFASS
jgi:hypothetical protein